MGSEGFEPPTFWSLLSSLINSPFTEYWSQMLCQVELRPLVYKIYGYPFYPYLFLTTNLFGIMYDVVIVGAGPIGCKLGELLSSDFKILIIDRKGEVGKPVQCTGLTSSRIFELSQVSRDVVLNEIHRSIFYSPAGNKIILEPKEPFYVLDRELFDKELASKAEGSGAKIMMKTKFTNFSRKNGHMVVKAGNKNFETRLLVGADGPNSTVAISANLFQPKRVLVGFQETVRGVFERNSCELWFGSKIAPEFFAWVVPVNEEWARIGVASSKGAGYHLEKFIGKRVGNFSEKRERVGGLIRVGLIKSSVADNILLVGDAASQMKPFSGGGLIYGLIGVRFAAEACRKALVEERYDEDFLRINYEKKWKKRLGWPILKGLFLSSIIHNSNDWLLDAGFWFLGKFSPIIEKMLDPDFI